jgi:hypothetical protein
MKNLESIDRRFLLANAVNCAHKKRGRTLWAVVRDLCGCGSMRAYAICVEMDWDPHQQASKHVSAVLVPDLPEDNSAWHSLPGGMDSGQE